MVLERKQAPGVEVSRDLQLSLEANRALQRRLEAVERKLFDVELDNAGRSAPPAERL